MRIQPLLPVLFSCCFCVAAAQSTTSDDVLKQRLHLNSRLYADRDHGESLRAKASRTSQDVTDTVVQLENYALCEGVCEVDPQNDPLIKRWVWASDVVAVGKVIDIVFELTPHEAFVFSDGQFVIDTVWHQSGENARSFGELAGKEVTVTFPGGRAEVDGHMLESHYSTEHPLIIGHTYLLFLKYIPDSQSYSLVGDRGFDLTDTVVRVLQDDPERESRPIMADKAGFIAAARSSVYRAEEEEPNAQRQL